MHKRLAEVLVGYSTEVQQGDTVRIESYDTSALPVMRETFGAALRAGGHPTANLVLEETEGILYNEGRDHQLDWISPDQQWNIEHGDVWIIFDAVTNTKRLSNVNPERISRRRDRPPPAAERYLERAEQGEFRWVLTAAPRAGPCAGRRACRSPVRGRAGSAPRFLDHGRSRRRLEAAFGETARSASVSSWTASGSSASSARTRTSSSVSRGEPGSARRASENFPDGEVFTAPARDERRGNDPFTFPAVIRGRQVDDVRLRFEEGEVVEATAHERRGLPARDGRHGRRSAAGR